MSKLVLSLGLLVASLTCYSFAASIKDIRVDKLPDDPALKAALADAQELEPWVRDFEMTWSAPVTQADSEARLAVDMKVAETARAKYPDNEEVALLSGLIASYAYNLEVKKSWDVAHDAFNAAIKLDSSDPRGAWFLAAHNCQTTDRLKEGMSGLLEVESRRPKNLPSSFWLDYMACATVTDMPAHANYAATRLAPADRADSQAVAILNNSKGAASLTQDYKPGEIWSATAVEGGVSFRSYACGISFTTPADWKPRVYPISGGKCAIELQIPSMKGKHGAWNANILVMSHAELPGDSFPEYAAHVEPKGEKQDNPQLQALCGYPNCRTADIFDKDMYPKEGGGHALSLQFERPQPQIAGIALEPFPIPPPKDRKTPYFSLPDYIARFPGNIYYTIAIDTTVSILPKANEDFITFVKSIRTD